MTDQSAVTVVVFRKWPKSEGGTVLALFPYEQASHGLCSSYEHVGQHGGADYAGCIGRTKPAKPEEYAALKRELESAPYHYQLDVRKRVKYSKHVQAVTND